MHSHAIENRQLMESRNHRQKLWTWICLHIEESILFNSRMKKKRGRRQLLTGTSLVSSNWDSMFVG